MSLRSGPTWGERGSLLGLSIASNILALALPLALLQVYDRIVPNQAQGTAVVLSVLLMLAASSGAALAGEQEPIEGCIDQLQKVGGPDARSGVEVLSSEFSQAGTLVKLRDAGGTVWRCIGYSDGAIGELRVVDAADDGGGAMAGAPSQSRGEPTTTTERVRFSRGSISADMKGTLTPGSSTRYIVGAKNGQDLRVRVAPQGGADLYYQIFNPDQSFLLEQIAADREYRGELWQSGDHVVEVINRSNRTASYNVIFSID